MNFTHHASLLRQQEFTRLLDAVVPRLEQLRSMTPENFRATCALMLERLGHMVIGDPAAAVLITSKNGSKFLTLCASPADRDPVKIPALRRLHDAVVANGALRGFLITARDYTIEARHYAESAPIDLIDGTRLVRALNQSRKHVLLPQTYKAMCCQCGGIVQHKLGDDDALPCENGHPVAPTIARAMLVPHRPSVAATEPPAPRPGARPSTRRHTRRVTVPVARQKPSGG